MSCTACGREDWVTIGRTKYCAHCGEPATPADRPAATNLPTGQAGLPIKPAAIAQAAPIASSLTLSDIKSAPAAISQPNPANSYHTPAYRQADVPVAASSPVVQPATSALDLRPKDSKPAKPKVGRPAKVMRRMDMKVAKAAPAQAKPTVQTPAGEDRTARVTAIEKSPAIRRFTPPRPVQQTQPTAKSNVAAPQLHAEKSDAPASSPLVTPEPTVIMPTTKSSAAAPQLHAGQSAQPVTTPAPIPAAPSAPKLAVPTGQAEERQDYSELPNQVLSQLKSMQGLIPPTAAEAGNKAKPAKSKAAPRAISIAAAGMASAVMAGYIWLNNYDSLTIKAAAQKAGIAATAPGYLPASYNLAGSISFGNGFVSMQYKSPADGQLLTINQRKSDLTPSSLLEVYVNKQAKTYLSVQSQGLTIYLLDNNQVTWVNRGIQYVLQGNSQLSREQLLKVAESL